jgi:Na+/H+ antiporter NhaD/arsenite permease-like protein
VVLLLAIGVLPLVAPHWWHPNRSKAVVAAALALPAAGWALATDPSALLHAGHEYASFVLLLASLYVVAGGIFLEGDLRATPRVNAAFLATGAVLANLVGTTGAAMLLVRPLLRTNAERKRVVHTVVFFVFVVCNTGGCLTPLADPPLYLGYLRGVPFEWTLRLLPYWAAMNGALLLVYLAWDTWAWRREEPAARRLDEVLRRPLGMRGARNLLGLAAIAGAVAARVPSPWLEGVFVAAGAASIAATPRAIREANRFAWAPILEVAILFAGIFATMVPALEILREEAPRLGLSSPRQLFWATGSLSSFLDNAPTYLTFLTVAQGLGGAPEVVGVPHATLAAVSLGAVFMGAMTYVGNGPNFMVRAIAESRGVRMPSFFGYMLYSGGVLLPLLALLSLAAW